MHDVHNSKNAVIHLSSFLIYIKSKHRNYFNASTFSQGLTNLESNALGCSIELDTADAAVQTIKPGDDLTIIFKATFPKDHYVEDVLIELFTDDINGTFAFLCKPEVVVGANLAVDTDRLTPVMESNTGYLISVS